MPPRLAAADPPAASRGPLSIRVYDLAGVSAEWRDEAIATARAALEDAGLNAVWLPCGAAGRGNDAACQTAVVPRPLVIRIARNAEPARVPASALGYSVVEASTGAAALATIFADRIELRARAAGADPALLMGRVIAHEVGHLLLGSNAHGVFGLMRGVWTDGELFANRPVDWQFTSFDRLRLRSRQGGASATATH